MSATQSLNAYRNFILPAKVRKGKNTTAKSTHIQRQKANMKTERLLSQIDNQRHKAAATQIFSNKWSLRLLFLLRFSFLRNISFREAGFCYTILTTAGLN
jgi:hypothetical protein